MFFFAHEDPGRSAVASAGWGLQAGLGRGVPLMMVMSGGNVAVTMVLALLMMSATIVSSFVYSSTRWSSDWNKRCNRSTGGRSSYRGTRICRQELTCGLQITVRIRGKKSREEDYTNQVRDWQEIGI